MRTMWVSAIVLLASVCLAEPAWAATDTKASFGSAPGPEEVVIPLNIYPPDIYRFDPRDVPSGVGRVVVLLSRNAWEDAGQDVAEVKVEYSPDGGGSWGFLFGFRVPGGESVNPNTGETQASSWVAFPLPEPDSRHRQVRGSVEMFRTIKTDVVMRME